MRDRVYYAGSGSSTMNVVDRNSRRTEEELQKSIDMEREKNNVDEITFDKALETKDRLIAAYKDMLDTVNERFEKTLKLNDSLTRENESLQAQLRILVNRTSSLTTKTMGLDDQVEELEANKQSLLNSIEALKELVETYRELKKELEKKLNATEKNCADATCNVEELQTTNALLANDHNATVETLLRDITNLELIIQELSTINAKLLEGIREQFTSYNALEMQLASCRTHESQPACAIQ